MTDEAKINESYVLNAMDRDARLYRAHAQSLVGLRMRNGDIAIAPTAVFDALLDREIEPEVGASGFYRRKNHPHA